MNFIIVSFHTSQWLCLTISRNLGNKQILKFLFINLLYKVCYQSYRDHITKPIYFYFLLRIFEIHSPIIAANKYIKIVKCNKFYWVCWSQIAHFRNWQELHWKKNYLGQSALANDIIDNITSTVTNCSVFINTWG